MSKHLPKRRADRPGLGETMTTMPQRHRRTTGFLAVLASMALLVTISSSGAYADDQQDAPMETPYSVGDVATEQAPDVDPAEPADATASETSVPAAEDSAAGESSDEPSQDQSNPPTKVTRGSSSVVAAPSVAADGITEVTITKRTFRADLTKVVGAKFELRGYSSGQTTPPAGGVVGSCTISAGNSCVVSVPSTGSGETNNKRFWVLETVAPAGTSALDFLATGDASTVQVKNSYPGLTPVLGRRSGSNADNNDHYAVAMPADGYQLANSSGSSLERVTSRGYVANRLDNVGPDLACNAQLKVALVLDKSGSISNAQRTPYAAGVGELLDTLAGSNTQVAAYGFNNGASSIAALGNPATIKPTVVSSILSSGTYANATDWDSGLRQALTGGFNVVIMVTDGAPNQYAGSGSIGVEFGAMEEAVLTANQLKSQGTQMIAVGVGNIGSGSAIGVTNLNAITGPVGGVSQSFVGDWDDLGNQLADVATTLTCQGAVKVNKTTVAANGTTTTTAAGWTFSATNPGPGTPTGTTAKTTSAGTPTVGWTYQFADKVTTTNVTVAETSQTGWAMTGVTCTGGVNPTVNLANGTFVVPGVTTGTNTTCTVTNSQDKGSLEITKTDASTGNAVPSTATGMVIRLNKNPLTGAAGNFDITDNGANDSDSAVGVIRIDNALLGTYSVFELTAPVGYLLPSSNPAKTLTLTTAGSKVSVNFVDPRKWAALTATKTATGTYDSSYGWSIEKKVKDAQGNWVAAASKNVAASGATGQGTFDYRVQVTQGARSATNVRVLGTISVTNPNSLPVTTNLADSFPGFVCTVNGGTTTVAVPANATTPYGYSCAGPDSLPANGTNTATVTWGKGASPQAQADLGSTSAYTVSPTAPVTFTEVGSTNKTVTVTDTKHDFATDPAGAWSITWTAGGGPYTRTYQRTLTADAGTCTGWDDNVAKVLNAQNAVLGSSTASAKLCVGSDLLVTKSATGSFTRTYLWNIRKVACDASTSAEMDACAPVVPQLASPANPDYTVSVTPGAPQTTGYQMTGTITVQNPNTWQAVTPTDIADDYLGATGEICTITTAKPWTIAASSSKAFAYQCTFTTAPSLNGTNQATVTWDQAAASTPSGTASGSHALDPDAEWTESAVNKTVHVYDVLTGGTPTFLGTVTWSTGLGATYFHPTHADLTAAAGECQNYVDTAWLAGTKSPNAARLGADDATVKVCGSHYTLDKSVSSTGTAQPGDTLTYTLTVHNDSQAVQQGFSVTDDLSGVVGNTGNPVIPVAPAGESAAYDPATKELTWTSTNALAVGASETLTYEVTINDGAWKVTLKNVATPGTDGDCVAAGECRTTTVTPHYTVAKASSPGTGTTVLPGSTVTYTLTVHNDSDGTVPGFSVTDDLSGVLDDATLVKPLAAGLAFDDDHTLTWTHVGDVAPGDDVTVSYEVTVDDDAWNATVKNVLVPGDGGDCVLGKCVTTNPTPHYKLTKASAPVSGSTVLPGTDVTYTLTVTNDSQGVLPGFSVSDDLGDVVDNTGDPVVPALPAGQTAPYDAATKTLTWTSTNALAVGDSVTLTYVVKVNDGAWGVSLGNVVSPGDSGDCAVGKCVTTNPTPHYTLAKSSSPESGSTVLPGSTVTYTLTVHNDSDGTVPGFSVTDDLSGVLDDATLVKPLAAGLAFDDDHTLTWTYDDDVAPGADVTVTYDVLVGTDAWESSLYNVAAPGAGGACVPDECATSNPTPHYTLAKSSEVDGVSVEPGSTITYTLTVHNDSEGTVPGFSVTDDLSDVLDDTTLVKPLAAGLVFDDAHTLTWTSGADLAPNATVTVEYQVKIKPDAWNRTIHNVAAPGAGTGGDCFVVRPTRTSDLVEGDPTNCETTDLTPPQVLPPVIDPPVVLPPVVLPPVVGPPVVSGSENVSALPNTGGPSSGLMYGGAALLLLGLGLVITGQRRTQR